MKNVYYYNNIRIIFIHNNFILNLEKKKQKQKNEYYRPNFI